MTRFYSIPCGALLAGLTLCNPADGLAASQHLIYPFGPIPDGSTPMGALTADASGRLYGAASGGGLFGFGAIYRLTRPATGAGPWTEEILHSFAGPDGEGPNGGLVFDAAGLLYGTTGLGGPSGGGEVFRLDPVSGVLTVLHAFSSAHKTGLGRRDGSNPGTGVVFGPGSLLYGTTDLGGDGRHHLDGSGIAFSVSPLGDTVEYAILHTFASANGSDGILPDSNLVVDGTNRFFGTTTLGGAYGLGTVFTLTLNASNYWVERVIYSFAPGGDVAYPQLEGALIRGAHNRLYGCAIGNGARNEGGVFSLTPPNAVGSAWTEQVLYSFGSQPGDLNGDVGCTVTAESSGRLLGNTAHGGQFYDGGGIFELTPPTGNGAAWTEAILHEFGQQGPGGFDPFGPLLPLAGTYYGVNLYGIGDSTSIFGYGTVYSYKP